MSRRLSKLFLSHLSCGFVKYFESFIDVKKFFEDFFENFVGFEDEFVGNFWGFR